jgi:hypothetical protein
MQTRLVPDIPCMEISSPNDFIEITPSRSGIRDSKPNRLFGVNYEYGADL